MVPARGGIGQSSARHLRPAPPAPCLAVSAHIFDLALADRARPRGDRLQLAFGAAVGYRRGDLDPSAGAVLRRLQDEVWPDRPILEHIRTLALEAGLALLCFDTRRVFPWFRGWRRQLRELAGLVGLEALTTTAYGTTEAVVLGAEDLLQFLARGDRERLGRAQERLAAAVRAELGPAEHLARWVAAHLLALAGERRRARCSRSCRPSFPTLPGTPSPWLRRRS